MKTFCDSYELRVSLESRASIKETERPSCIDLILTNSPCSFQNSCAIENGLSDFHKKIDTVMNAKFEKLKPKIIYYRDYIIISEIMSLMNLGYHKDLY